MAIRRKAKGRRGAASKRKATSRAALKQRFGTWLRALKKSNTGDNKDNKKAESSTQLADGARDDIEALLDQFAPVISLISQVEQLPEAFLEFDFASDIVEQISDNNNAQSIKVACLFALSDLVDSDRTGILGDTFCDQGVVEIALNILRSKDQDYENEIQLKTACICALSSLSMHDMELIVDYMDQREILLLNNMLQVKSMMHLHSRCIVFINNIYINGRFKPEISQYIIPSVMTLLMYNVTNHIKLSKHSSKRTITDDYEGDSEIEAEKPTTELNPEHDNNGSTYTAPDVRDYDVDPMYNDDLYGEFIEHACHLLGNLTTDARIFLLFFLQKIFVKILNIVVLVSNCILAEKYSIIDIMTLLFHNTDTTLESLTSVIKCLANLAVIPEHKDKLMDSNILPIAIKLIKLEIEDEMKAQITLLLANMCSYETVVTRLVEGGVVQPVIKLLWANRAEFQRFAAMALANLGQDVNAIQFMVKHGVLPRAIDLCYSADPSLQRQAMRLLNVIASYPTGLYWRLMREMGAVEAIRHVYKEASKYEKELPQPSAKRLADSTLRFLLGKAKVLGHVPRHLNKAFLQTPITEQVVKVDSAKALIEKEKGNGFFRKRKHSEALSCYTKAIEYNPTDCRLYSNRAATFVHLERYDLALKDAMICAELDPDWVKGHFRKGKALMGLHHYSEAVVALRKALELERNNKEIQDAMKLAWLKQRDNASKTCTKFGKLNIFEVLEWLHMPCMFDFTGRLLSHMFELLKQYFRRKEAPKPPKPDNILGSCGLDAVENGLLGWALSVDIGKLLELEGVRALLFETDMSSANTTDQSCYYFGKFVVTVLCRLVLEGNPHHGIKALQRLIQLGQKKNTRNSIGLSLHHAIVYISGEEVGGMPMTPLLRQLFLQYGGLQCIAMHTRLEGGCQGFAVDYICGLSMVEWRRRSAEQLQTVIEEFVIPALDQSDNNGIRTKAEKVFGKLYSLRIMRDIFTSWVTQSDKEFVHYVAEELRKYSVADDASLDEQTELELEPDLEYYLAGVDASKTAGSVDGQSQDNQGYSQWWDVVEIIKAGEDLARNWGESKAKRLQNKTDTIKQ